MFPDYKKLVVFAYQTKRSANALSPNLQLPTPAKLKEECLLVCQERYLKKDEKLFRAFFEPREDKVSYMSAIKSADIDKFKPLCNFLKDGSIRTSERNIELLALLIDFEPRPYQIDRTYDKPGITDPPKGAIPVNEPKTRWYALVALLLVALIGGGVYSSRKTKAESCMIWAVNHYQTVPCNGQNGELNVIAADTSRLAHFKKIDKPDTITGRSLGKIWYIKLNGEIEYYTGDGPHPIYPDRKLRPLTLYMLNKYIRHL